jgi:hypothetical protein
VSAPRRFDVTERRARLARRHHLASPAADVTELAARLVGLHATDPATVFLSARARLDGATTTHLEDALYEQRSLVKYLGMRRTLFVLPVELVPRVRAACTDKILANERRRLIADVEAGGVATDGGKWLRRAERATVAALTELGEATGAQLSRAVPEIQAKLRVGEGKKWGGDVGVAGRVYTVLAAECRIRRGRPASWTSSQHRWAMWEHELDRAPMATATDDLVQRWLRAFGPATVADVAWWTGLGLTPVRAALSRLGAIDVEIEVDREGTSAAGVALPDDLEREVGVEPWAALLPGLDASTMGWKHRDWYLAPHGPSLTDASGNVGPTIWWDGRIVGGWIQRKSGELVHRVLDDVGADGRAAIERELDRLRDWLGDTVVAPRFPGPLDRELRA